MLVQNKLVWLALGVSGCFTRYTEPPPNVDELQAQLSALQAQVDQFSAQLATKADAAALAGKADAAALEGLVDQAALDAALAQKQDAATAATDAELAAATDLLVARLDTIDTSYVSSAALAAAIDGLDTTYVSYDALESGTFDTSQWFEDGAWFNTQVVLESELVPTSTCDEACVAAIIADYVGPADGLLTEQELAARGFTTAADLAAERAWVLNQGYASGADIAAGDAAERAWVLDQGYATESWVAAAYPEQLDLDELVQDLGASLAGAVRVYDPETWPDRDPATLRVPSDFPDVQSALDSLAGRRLLSPVSVDVEPAHCGSVYTRPIVVDHPDGAMLTVRTAPEVGGAANCYLLFEGAINAPIHGLVVAPGRTLGELNGVQLACNNPETCGHGLLLADGASVDATDVWFNSFGGDGIHLERGARMTSTRLITVQNEGFGLSATFGSTFVDTATGQPEGMVVNDNAAGGLNATWGATVYAPYVMMEGGELGATARYGGLLNLHAAAMGSFSGPGIVAQDNAFILADYANVSGAGTTGIYAGTASINAYRATIGYSGTNNITANNSAFIGADEVRLLGGEHGVEAAMGSTVRAWDATTEGSQLDGFAAHSGSTLLVPAATSTGSLEGGGFVADGGSSLFANGAIARDNAGDGFSGTEGAHLTIAAAVSQSNLDGVLLADGATCFAEGLDASDNVYWGVLVMDGSVLSAPDASLENNGLMGGIAINGSSMLFEGGTCTDNVSGGISASQMSWVNAENANVSGNGGNALGARYDASIYAAGASVSGTIDPVEVDPSDINAGVSVVWR